MLIQWNTKGSSIYFPYTDTEQKTCDNHAMVPIHANYLLVRGISDGATVKRNGCTGHVTVPRRFLVLHG